MKGFIYSVWLSCLACTAAAQESQSAPTQELPPLQNPEQVSIHREAPRTQLYSYNKKEFALAGDTSSSTYMQKLGGEWKVKTFSAPTPIDSVQVTADASFWPGITPPQKGDNGAWAAIYRHEFKMPFAWIDREVFAHVDPVHRAYYLYINGRLAGYHEDSKTPAEFDITKLVTEGKNHMAIVAYADPVSTTLENQIQTKGTALQGDVYVFAQPKVRMRDYVIDTRFAPDGTSGLFNFGVIVKSAPAQSQTGDRLLRPVRSGQHAGPLGQTRRAVRDAPRRHRTLFRKYPEHRIVEPRKPETLHRCAAHPA